MGFGSRYRTEVGFLLRVKSRDFLDLLSDSELSKISMHHVHQLVDYLSSGEIFRVLSSHGGEDFDCGRSVAPKNW